MYPPRRIVCLTEETVEALYLMGEDARIVGVSGYAVRPPQVRREKPRVAAFTSAKIDKILELEPDLVLTFSDLQAEIVADLVKAGIAVHAFNQRDIAGIFDMLRMLGGLIGEPEKAEALCARLEARLAEVRAASAKLPRRPKVYFEEWDEPMITGIGWVSELIGIAGGEECFPQLVKEPSASNRIIGHGDLLAADPDIFIGSWCGKKFQPDAVRARPGYEALTALRTGALHEVKSTIILQPGPAALTDGLEALVGIIHGWAAAQAA